MEDTVTTQPQLDNPAAPQTPTVPAKPLISGILKNKRLIRFASFTLIFLFLFVIGSVILKQYIRFSGPEPVPTPTPIPGAITYDIDLLYINHQKYHNGKKCTAAQEPQQPESSQSTVSQSEPRQLPTLITFMKYSKQRVVKDKPVYENNVWLSDKDGCNHQQLSTAADVCKIFGISPDNKYVLVAQCLDTGTEGTFYKALSVIDINGKTIKELIALSSDGTEKLNAFWVDDENIWYYFNSLGPKFYKEFVNNINVNGKVKSITYPEGTRDIQSSNFVVSPKANKIYLDESGVIKQFSISFPRPVYLEGKDISVSLNTEGADNKHDFFTSLNNKLLFRQNGELYTTDFEGNNKSVITKTDPGTVTLKTLDSSGTRALYPVNDCWVPDNPKPFAGRQIGFYSGLGTVTVFTSKDLIFANELKGYSSECSDWYVLDTSGPDLAIMGVLCNEGDRCFDVVIN